MSTKIQLRRGTATQWTTANPVLAAGEVGYETDTGNIKVGTGTAGSGAWNNLPYYQLPRVSVDPVTTSNLNAANYLVQGIYRLATNSNSGVTWTGTPTDFHSANTAESTLTVTIHQYTGQTTLTQQVLTQRTTTTGNVKQWVRLWDGTTFTAWSSTSHLSDNEVTTATIVDATSTTDGVTNSKLRWSAARSVIGRSAATDGAPADIVAGTDGHVLRRSGTDILFGTIVSDGIASNAITTAKIADDAVTAAKLADDASTDANRAVTTDHIRDSAVTTAKIAGDAVTFAKMQNSATAGLSVVGRATNSAGDFAEINAANDGEVLRRSGNAVGFGTITSAGIAASAVGTSQIAANAVTAAKLSAIPGLTGATYFSGSGTFTVPTGVTGLLVTAVGGGGGGASQNPGGNGGVGGCLTVLFSVAPGTGIAYSVGAGGAGAGQGSTNQNGAAGGSTTFLGMTAGGGAGGAGANSGSNGTTSLAAATGGTILAEFRDGLQRPSVTLRARGNGAASAASSFGNAFDPGSSGQGSASNGASAANSAAGGVGGMLSIMYVNM